MRGRAVRIGALALGVLWAVAGTAAASPAGARTVIQVFPGPNAISEALAPAESGDVLEIHAGTYPEQVTISVPGVTLRAAGDGPVVIDGTCAVEITVDVQADRVTLRGLRVVGAGGFYPVEINFRHISAGRVLDSVVEDTCGGAEYGINVAGSGSIRLIGNTASGFADAGFYVGGTTAMRLGDLTVRGNTSFGNDKGIIVAYTTLGGVVVEGNTVYGNTRSGIWLNHSRFVEVSRNAVGGNGYSGIEVVRESSGNVIRSNVALGQTYDLVDTSGPNCWTRNVYVSSLGDIGC